MVYGSMSAQLYLDNSIKDTPNLFKLVFVGNHQTTTVGNTVVSLSLPANANILLIQAIDNPVRYRFDGGNPSTTSGFRLRPEDGLMRFDFNGAQGPLNLIAAGASAAEINYQWCALFV